MKGLTLKHRNMISQKIHIHTFIYDYSWFIQIYRTIYQMAYPDSRKKSQNHHAEKSNQIYEIVLWRSKDVSKHGNILQYNDDCVPYSYIVTSREIYFDFGNIV